jgi:hypothetical protein
MCGSVLAGCQLDNADFRLEINKPPTTATLVHAVNMSPRLAGSSTVGPVIYFRHHWLSTGYLLAPCRVYRCRIVSRQELHLRH